MPLMRSWVQSANAPGTDFPLNNLPCGCFSLKTDDPIFPDVHCGVAIGDMVLDVTALEEDGLLILADEDIPLFDEGSWNVLMEVGSKYWKILRDELIDFLAEGSDRQSDIEPYLVPMGEVNLHLPFQVSEFTDFYAGRHHATNVGTMFRGAENALPPNWLHIPIGYNGRASSVVVSGTEIRRPWGQVKAPDQEMPEFRPCRRFDIELEMGAVVGGYSRGPVTVQEADAMIFGYVLLNDWSARDIQAWEYQPLGPFQGKATATTISPWIVTKAALEPFRTSTPERETPLLEYLQEPGPMLYDIALSVAIQPEGAAAPQVLARTNYNRMYYSAAQQLAHHSTSGCPMNTGDLLGSGTISGPTKDERGSLLELSWGGKEPIALEAGGTRSFIEDGDTLILSGAAEGDGYRIGFGDCIGKVLPALEDPYGRDFA
jgi:fumarylacetoacetase